MQNLNNDFNLPELNDIYIKKNLMLNEALKSKQKSLINQSNIQPLINNKKHNL